MGHFQEAGVRSHPEEICLTSVCLHPLALRIRKVRVPRVRTMQVGLGGRGADEDPSFLSSSAVAQCSGPMVSTCRRGA